MSLPDLPGSGGLPLIGETLAFLRDSYGFTARRVEQYGPIFQTSILGKRRVVISGTEACARWVDGSLIQRADSMPGPLREIFGGASLQLLDGPAHIARKHQVRSAFTPERVASYVPDLQAIIDSFLSDTADSADPIRAVASLRELAIRCICKNVMGLDPEPQVDSFITEYQIVFSAAGGIPLDLPGTSRRRAKEARDRIFAMLDRLISERRAEPTGDGLSTMLLATGPGGERIDDVACRLELHHLVLAGYIVFGELVGALLQLDRHADVKQRLSDEVLTQVPSGPLNVYAIGKLAYLEQVVLELKRHTPVVNVFFGIAKRDFELYGHRIPKGRSLILSLTDCNRPKEIWSEPHRFDPERFGPGRTEHERHEHAYVPQGAGEMYGSHACAGLEYTTILMSVFLIQSLRGYDWSLPEQDLSYDRRKIPAEPKDGLLLSLVRR